MRDICATWSDQGIAYDDKQSLRRTGLFADATSTSTCLGSQSACTCGAARDTPPRRYPRTQEMCLPVSLWCVFLFVTHRSFCLKHDNKSTGCHTPVILTAAIRQKSQSRGTKPHDSATQARSRHAKAFDFFLVHRSHNGHRRKEERSLTPS